MDKLFTNWNKNKELEIRVSTTYFNLFNAYNKIKSEAESISLQQIILGYKHIGNVTKRVEIILKKGNSDKIFSEKNQLYNYFPNIESIGKIKCVLSEEKPLNKDNINMQDFSFKSKIRISLLINDWSWDFTYMKPINTINSRNLHEILLDEKKQILDANITVDNFFNYISQNQQEYSLEIEYKGVKNPEASIDNIIQKIKEILSDNKSFDILKTISKLLNFKYSISNIRQILKQPINFTLEEYMDTILPDIDNYYLLDKADGERGLLFIHTKSTLVLLNKEISNDLVSETPYIYDVEYINGNILVFDVLMFNGEDVRHLPFNKREQMLGKQGLFKKPMFRLSKDPENKNYYKTLIPKIYKNSLYEIDGLIFTQADMPYKDTISYKWKPMEKLSIDFLLMKAPASYPQKKGKTLYLLFNGYDPTTSRVKLEKPDEYNEIFKNMIQIKPTYYPMLFSVNELNEDNKKDLYLYYYDGELDLNQKVCELVYINSEWNFIKIREDKNVEVEQGIRYGNDMNTAINTFNTYLTPITIEDLIGESKSYFNDKKNVKYNGVTKFNNFVKAQITKQFEDYDSLLDLACGRGADMFVYNGYNIKKLVMVDVDKNAIIELNKRKEDLTKDEYYIYNSKPKTTAEIETYVQDLSLPNKTIFATLPKAKYSAITMNFAIHYLLNEEKNIRKVCELVDNYLQSGGVFLITLFDGKKVFDLLKNTDYNKTYDISDIYSIKKEYKNTKFEHGLKIGVMLPFSNNEYYTEPLVDINLLIDTFLKFGFKLRQKGYFSEFLYKYKMFNPKKYATLDENDIKFISLYYYLGFFKV